MSSAQPDPGTDAGRLRARGLRVTGPRLAILGMLEQVGGHRSADELVLALRRAGYHHARTTVYNALDDLARAHLVRAAPVDAGALRYEANREVHHHFVCRRCGAIRNVDVAADLAERPLPQLEGVQLDELDVVYRGVCAECTDDAGVASIERAARGRVDGPEPTAPELEDEPEDDVASAGGATVRMSHSAPGGAVVDLPRSATPAGAR